VHFDPDVLDELQRLWLQPCVRPHHLLAEEHSVTHLISTIQKKGPIAAALCIISVTTLVSISR
jgi:hypothetical protein